MIIGILLKRSDRLAFETSREALKDPNHEVQHHKQQAGKSVSLGYPQGLPRWQNDGPLTPSRHQPLSNGNVLSGNSALPGKQYSIRSNCYAFRRSIRPLRTSHKAGRTTLQALPHGLRGKLPFLRFPLFKRRLAGRRRRLRRAAGYFAELKTFLGHWLF
jgi:hypothetical protein